MFNKLINIIKYANNQENSLKKFFYEYVFGFSRGFIDPNYKVFDNLYFEIKNLSYKKIMIK